MNNDAIDFLKSAESYEEAQRFWRGLWEEVSQGREVGWQTPWLQEPPATLRDGNPIFTAWSHALRRGIRIIQREPSSHVPDLTYWLDVFGGNLREPNAVEELVLNCSPRSEIIHPLKALMSSW